MPGKYYADNTCIDCDLCRDDGGYSYVFKQPQTVEETAQAEEARISCPTETIGNDGE